MSSSNISKYCFCLTRKMTRMIEPPHISNVLHNAQSNRCRPPPSPNTAPDTTKWSCPKCRRNARKQVKRHLQGGGDPRMIRTWSEHETVSPQPASKPRLIFRVHHERFFAWKKYSMWHSVYHPKFTKYCTSHQNDAWTSPDAAPATKSDTWLCYDVTVLLITRLCYFLTMIFLDDSSAGRFYYLTLLFLDDSIPWRFYCWTILLLDFAIAWWFYYLTLLLLDDSISWLWY